MYRKFSFIMLYIYKFTRYTSLDITFYKSQDYKLILKLEKFDHNYNGKWYKVRHPR